MDFDSTQVDIVFEPDNSPGRECAVVTIFDDAILEDKEDFLVELTSADPDITILDPRMINVAILDNDGINSLSTATIANYVVYISFTHLSRQPLLLVWKWQNTLLLKVDQEFLKCV